MTYTAWVVLSIAHSALVCYGCISIFTAERTLYQIPDSKLRHFIVILMLKWCLLTSAYYQGSRIWFSAESKIFVQLVAFRSFSRKAMATHQIVVYLLWKLFYQFVIWNRSYYIGSIWLCTISVCTAYESMHHAISNRTSSKK